jgi:transposase
MYLRHTTLQEGPQGAPLVQAYQAMSGASFLVAVTFAAEIGDVCRFETPRQLMSFLGLVRSTGEHVHRQGLTLAGDRRAAPRVDRSAAASARAVSKRVRDIAYSCRTEGRAPGLTPGT